MRGLMILALLSPYALAAGHWAVLRRAYCRRQAERIGAEHAAYFARLRLVGERLLTTREAAELAQVSEQTIRAWTRRGKLCAHKDERGHNRYRAADVLAADLRARQTRHRIDGPVRRPAEAG